MGTVYYGQSFVNRSFVVENRSEMPLHFSISHTLAAELGEIAFSLSNTTLKLFSTLLVPPANAKRVYLHFRAEMPSSTISSAASARGTAAEDSFMASTNSLLSSSALLSRRIACEIAVRCHLVKDYEEEIKLTAACYPPSFRLSTTELDFHLPDPRAALPSEPAPTLTLALETCEAARGGDPESLATSTGTSPAVLASSQSMSPLSALIQITSLSKEPLPYSLRSSCCFFKIHTPSGGRGGIIESSSCPEHSDYACGSSCGVHNLLITPDVVAIRQHASLLVRLRFVEEHFTIYNRSDLNEHEYVTLRLAVGPSAFAATSHIAGFSYAPSRHLGSYASALLEEQILAFHAEFKSFWDGRLGPVFTAHALARVARARGSPDPLLSCANFAHAQGDGTTGSTSEALREARWPGYPGTATIAALASTADAASAGGSTGCRGGSDAASVAAEPEGGECSLYISLMAAIDAGARDDVYARLWADFRHITDELVYYGTKAQTSHFVSPLATLCYKVLFRHEVFDAFRSASARQHRRLPLLAGGEARPFPAPHLEWFKQLSYFLMHFPDADANTGMDTLRKLERALVAGCQIPQAGRAVSRGA